MLTTVANATGGRKISLSEINTPLLSVMERISDQTGFDFILPTSLLSGARPVTIQVREMEVELVLKKIFQNQPFNFIIRRTMIVISPKTVVAESGSTDTTRRPVKISGTVSDTSGKPLGSATVQIKARSLFVYTDESGRFSITGENGDEILISFVGFKDCQFQLKQDMPSPEIVLYPENTIIQEINVVSTGYQNIPRERATGSFSFMNTTQVNRRVSSDIIGRLEGMVPGMLFNRNTSGSARGGTDISIRGTNTLFSNSQPLIVLDGFPFDGDVANINPNDIESVTVLKDAAAASIWGVRSGNGVIVLTSKRGRRNEPLSVSFNANATVSDRPNLRYNRGFLPSGEYIDVEQRLFDTGFYDAQLTDPAQVISPAVEIMLGQRNGILSRDEAAAQLRQLRDQDIRDGLASYFYQRSVQQQYSLNFKGGSDRSDYYFSAGEDHNLTTMTGNSRNRVTLNGNYNFYPLKDLQVSATLNYIRTVANVNTTLDNVSPGGRYGNFVFPYTRLADPVGNALPVVKGINPQFARNARQQGYLDWLYRPLDELLQTDNRSDVIHNRLILNTRYTLLPGLGISLNYRYEKQATSDNSYYDVSTFYARNLINMYSQFAGDHSTVYPVPNGGILQNTEGNIAAHNVRGILNFDRSLGEKHMVNAIAGAEISSSVNEQHSSTAYGYDRDTRSSFQQIDYAGYYNLNPERGSAQIPNSQSFGKYTDHYISYFANAAYTYIDRYTLTLSGRIDRSNLFGVATNQKSVPLYSIGLGWDTQKEPFFNILKHMAYVELQITTNFSFLRGGSHPDELVGHAAELGYREVAVTDRNSFAGLVRAHVAAKARGIRLIPACRLDLQDGPSLLAYPRDKAAYARLSALLTEGNRRAEKGKCFLYKADVFNCTAGMIYMLIPPQTLNKYFEFEDAFKSDVAEYARAIPGLYIAASRTYLSSDQKRLFRIQQLAEQHGLKTVATNDVHFHDACRRELQDVLTCVREKCTIDQGGYLLHANAERYLKPPTEMARIFRVYPEAIAETRSVANACTFSLDELEYVYPEEISHSGRTPLEELRHLTREGVQERFGDHPPEKLLATIRHELNFVEEMDYANYFLFVHDIVKEARSRGILCQGRGSAANSAVCYVLGITSVDPTKFDLLFERFISSVRNEPPDIDVDFEHERREEIIQYIYDKYGRDRAAIVATVTQQRQKGAIRDVGKVMGLSQDTIDRLSAAIWEFTDEWFEPQRLAEQGLNPDDPQLRKVLKLTAEMLGFPRQLGQHTGGFVVTQGRLTDLCPIINARMEHRSNIEWNKDDIEALGFLKVDVLALGMLTCIRKTFDLCRQHYGLELTLANVPQDDPGVYEMASQADTIGVFQIESRAQQSMLPRLRPKCFYDLVIEVAIVRPGPIQGDMVHPYLRRRNGEEPVTYPSKELEEILGRTLGVPLFQEQAMKIAMVAAGFTPTEADGLRRSMATFKFKGMVNAYQEKLVGGMTARGYSQEFAERIFKQLEGFGSYGFPESHAASFALLVYVSLWLKCYYPDAFAAALLNSQPMGFYQPAQIVIDAKKHGVEVRPVDVNHSDWDNTLEERTGYLAPLRLGFRQVKGVREEDMLLLIAHREKHYKHISEIYDAGVSQAALEKLADADAFRSMGLDRRRALWEIAALADTPMGLFRGQASDSMHEAQIALPFMSAAEQVIRDYAATSLSLKAHPVGFARERLNRLAVLSAEGVFKTRAGRKVRVAGIVLSRQRPGTAGGVCFMTVEDETGTVNLVVFEKLFETYRKEILGSKLLMVQGWVQREGQVLHVIAKSCHDLTALLEQPDCNTRKQDDELPFQAENKRTQLRENVAGNVIPKARNFR